VVENAEGFLNPEIDFDKCVKCGLCVRSCPVLNKPVLHRNESPNVYACWHEDITIRRLSSSGGVFSALAESILDSGGIVFGAAYDPNMHVRHIGINNKANLDVLRQSKYVQSEIGNVFQDVRKALIADLLVLFAGTPCQISGLHKYLQQDYSNLVTCDLICHGVPSPKVFTKYLKWIENSTRVRIESLNFRDKEKGWENSRTVATLHTSIKHPLLGKYNSYYNGFVDGLYLRDCCYKCQFNGLPRQADLTLGDFWGIGNQIPFAKDHEKRDGISVVLANSDAGQMLISKCQNICVIERPLQEVVEANAPLISSASRPLSRDSFFKDLPIETWDVLVKRYLRVSFKRHIRIFVREHLSVNMLSFLRNAYKRIRR